MRVDLFLLSIFTGRAIRFLILGELVVKFGPGIVTLVSAVMARHLVWVFLGFALLLAITLSHMQLKKKRKGEKSEPTEAA